MEILCSIGCGSVAALLNCCRAFGVERLTLRAHEDGLHIHEMTAGGAAMIKALIPASSCSVYRVEPGFTVCVDVEPLCRVLRAAAERTDTVELIVDLQQRSKLTVRCHGGEAVIHSQLPLCTPPTAVVHDASSQVYDNVVRLSSSQFARSIRQVAALCDVGTTCCQIAIGDVLRFAVDHGGAQTSIMVHLPTRIMGTYYSSFDPIANTSTSEFRIGHVVGVSVGEDELSLGVYRRDKTKAPSRGTYKVAMLQQMVACLEHASEFVELFQTDTGFLVCFFGEPFYTRIALSPVTE